MRGFTGCAFLFHQDKGHPVELPLVFSAGGDDVDPGGVDTTVTQNIRQLGNVVVNGVELPGK